MDFLLASTTTVAILLSLAISGTSANMECGVMTCPNILNKIHDAVTDESSKSFCCKTKDFGIPYCCDWKDYGVYMVGLDPNNLAIPVGAIIGIVVGGVVLLILLSICCCFCCSCCCFRGRKRVITQHHTVQYAPTTMSSVLPATTPAGDAYRTGSPYHPPYAPLTNNPSYPRPDQALSSSSSHYNSPPPYNPHYNENDKY